MSTHRHHYKADRTRPVTPTFMWVKCEQCGDFKIIQVADMVLNPRHALRVFNLRRTYN
ncbi:hypothetical protein SEA_CRUNCHYBOI_19 [Microbacterium phage CrunchyBoi]|nr:hypothetical protein SEA_PINEAPPLEPLUTO_19 [Microbacterium phage PineapplePluto]QQO39362.1 hypothetical protein SEA_CRUNCHYBOI_19 [Microbacterium phage CrunchyBoi]